MSMTKQALITGIFGQDGSYLTELLLSKGYDVFGFARDEDMQPKGFAHIYADVTMFRGDMGDQESIECAICASMPDEVYNLAAPSSVMTSLEQPVMTSEATALGPVRFLEALRKYRPEARFFQASSSEIFGDTNISPQNEMTACVPRNPYGAAKLFAHHMVSVFRKQFGVYAVSGILYNHESPRRGEVFVTKKITSAVAQIKHGRKEKLVLGDLQARRDWGYAPEYVEAMWRMLQQDEPGDFVIATGVAHSVEEFVKAAFSYVNLDWHEYVKVDELFARRSDTVLLVGDASKARTKLLWKPKIPFTDLVHMMVEEELRMISDQRNE